jgi:hypothetical protein
LHENSPRDIFEWYETSKKGYDVEGLVEIGPGGSTAIWGAAAASAPRGSEYFEILKRRD